jgi:hypothetical protein
MLNKLQLQCKISNTGVEKGTYDLKKRSVADPSDFYSKLGKWVAKTGSWEAMKGREMGYHWLGRETGGYDCREIGG